MAIGNLDEVERILMQSVSRAGSSALRIKLLDRRLTSEVEVVISALQNIEERLKDLYPNINVHLSEMEVERRATKHA